MKLKSLILILFSLPIGHVSASEAIQAQPIEVEIVGDDGGVFARYDLAGRSRDGDLRAYLEAERGRNYGVRVRNHTGGRIGLVIAVDGRNILSGQQSHLRADEPMYVLGANEQSTYEGWRTSDATVHRFYFTEVEDSYAEAWGDRSAMGVIVVAAFREVPPVHSERRSQTELMAPQGKASGDSRSAESPALSDAARAAGTGFGERHDSRSVRVHFEPQRRAFAKQFLKYEWRESLVRLGIIREAPPANRFWPEQIGQTENFAPYPPGYWSRRR
jgi:hypothetical protein